MEMDEGSKYEYIHVYICMSLGMYMYVYVNMYVYVYGEVVLEKDKKATFAHSL